MEKKHWCRVCRKSFPSGRSLGGHMRSHVALASPPAEEEEKGEKSGYGLRENPKKTWRCFPHESPEKICRECGKSFQSWKALFGHMRCHSRAGENEQEEEHEGSWSFVLSGNEMAAPARRRRTTRTGATAAVAAGSSSSVSMQDEQEEAALTLMTLSRDRWGVSESSDKSSAVGGELVSIVSDELGGDEKGKSPILDSEPKKPPTFFLSCGGNDEESEEESKKKARLEQWDSKKIGSLDDFSVKFKCTTCNKSFHSYQALGGHRAGHRRNPGGCLDTETSADRTVAMGVKAHECLICGKCFPSGQALGGHKRSHVALNSDESTLIPPQQNPAALVPDCIDLNLPVPVEEEPKFRPWWKYEAMVGV